MTPRPLVHRCPFARQQNDEKDDLMGLLKAQINQDGIRRSGEHERREQERNDREEERREERKRRLEDSQTHESLMQMMMMTMCKLHNKDVSKFA